MNVNTLTKIIHNKPMNSNDKKSQISDDNSNSMKDANSDKNESNSVDGKISQASYQGLH